MLCQKANPYNARINLNGKSKIPPTILNINSIVKPKILNGIKIIQANINKKKSTIANGQHITKRIHRSRNAIIVFILKV